MEDTLHVSLASTDAGLMLWRATLRDGPNCTLCVDTGADGSIITSEFVKANRLKTTPIPPKRIITAGLIVDSGKLQGEFQILVQRRERNREIGRDISIGVAEEMSSIRRLARDQNP